MTEEQRRGRKLEEDVARLIGGKLIPGSGSGRQKADVSDGHLFLVECKYRSSVEEDGNPYIALDLQWLEAVYRQALQVDKVPVLVIEWLPGDRMTLLPQEAFCELTGERFRVFPPVIYLGRAPKHNLDVWKRLLKISTPRVHGYPDLEIDTKFWVACELDDLQKITTEHRPSPPPQPISKWGNLTKSNLRGGSFEKRR